MIGSSDAGGEPDDEAEDAEEVEVMGELEPVQFIAGEDGENAVDGGDFVDDEGEVDEFGGGTQGDEVEERL
jgi:hypothetical protein